MVSISRSWLCVGLVLLCVAAILVDPVEAGRKKKGGRRRQDGVKRCKYRSQKTQCDPVHNTRNMTLTLKKGDPDCPETKVMKLSCKKLEGCMYKSRSVWTECDPHTNRRSLVKELVEGSPESCPSMHIRVRRCKKKAGKRRGGGRRKKLKAKNKKKKNRKSKRRQRKMDRKMRRKEAKARREQQRGAVGQSTAVPAAST